MTKIRPDSLKLILASSSPFRRDLLERLSVGFICETPAIDETPLPGESADELVKRLARTKAEAVAKNRDAAIVIGSDQCLSLNNEILGKPGSHEAAMNQLEKLSGQTVIFYTGLCVVNSSTGVARTDCIPCRVTFRRLTRDEIGRYLEIEKPYQCAGSFRSERLGISLLEKLECTDPTALIGLPLIRLSEMLRAQGLPIP